MKLSDLLSQLPEICRDERRRRGLDYRAAGLEMGLSHSSLHRFENHGRSSIDTTVSVVRWLESSSHLTLGTVDYVRERRRSP